MTRLRPHQDRNYLMATKKPKKTQPQQLQQPERPKQTLLTILTKKVEEPNSEPPTPTFVKAEEPAFFNIAL